MGLLVSVFLVGSVTSLVAVVGILVIAGMLSSLYSSMQSALIYTHCESELRSPTFSLMTLSIGTGALGTVNVTWMGHYLMVSEVVMVLAAEGIIALMLVLAIVRCLTRRPATP